jgi:hypothetical protein
MWDEFSMSGHYEIDGLDNFIARDATIGELSKAPCIR